MSKFGTRRANGSINTRTRSIQSYHLRQRSLTAAFALLDPPTGQELSVEGYAETSGLRDRLPEIHGPRQRPRIAPISLGAAHCRI